MPSGLFTNSQRNSLQCAYIINCQILAKQVGDIINRSDILRSYYIILKYNSQSLDLRISELNRNKSPNEFQFELHSSTFLTWKKTIHNRLLVLVYSDEPLPHVLLLNKTPPPQSVVVEYSFRPSQ